MADVTVLLARNRFPADSVGRVIWQQKLPGVGSGSMDQSVSAKLQNTTEALGIIQLGPGFAKRCYAA